MPLIGDERCPYAHVGDLEPVDETALSYLFLNGISATRPLRRTGLDARTTMLTRYFARANETTTPTTITRKGEIVRVTLGALERGVGSMPTGATCCTESLLNGTNTTIITFSYETCRNADILTRQARIDNLHGTRLRVGLNSNSGGCKGVLFVNPKHSLGWTPRLPLARSIGGVSPTCGRHCRLGHCRHTTPLRVKGTQTHRNLPKIQNIV